MAARFPDIAFTCCAVVKDAVADADIVCTLTSSTQPILEVLKTPLQCARLTPSLHRPYAHANTPANP
jgi:hypothetical protein